MILSLNGFLRRTRSELSKQSQQEKINTPQARNLSTKTTKTMMKLPDQIGLLGNVFQQKFVALTPLASSLKAVTVVVAVSPSVERNTSQKVVLLVVMVVMEVMYGLKLMLPLIR
jgi:hypothetical protein